MVATERITMTMREVPSTAPATQNASAQLADGHGLAPMSIGSPDLDVQLVGRLVIMLGGIGCENEAAQIGQIHTTAVDGRCSTINSGSECW